MSQHNRQEHGTRHLPSNATTNAAASTAAAATTITTKRVYK
jgi:hypothetical protein